MKLRRTLALAIILSLSLAGLGAVSAGAQRRAYRASEAQMRQLLRRIETRADHFRHSLSNALDRSRYNGTAREDEVNRLLTDFEYATDQLRDRFNSNTSAGTDVQLVLERAAQLDTFMHNNRLANPRSGSGRCCAGTSISSRATTA
jgi:hypothetical protein